MQVLVIVLLLLQAQPCHHELRAQGEEQLLELLLISA